MRRHAWTLKLRTLRRFLAVVALAAGCQSPRATVQPTSNLASAISFAGPHTAITPCSAVAATPDFEHVNLAGLWQLALGQHPALSEAAAEVEAARGKWIQAGLYPNPRFSYNQGTIGSRAAPQGNFGLQLNQEIVTGGKRLLDQAVAERETSAAVVGLVGRKFETLSRIRRAYFDYRSLLVIAQVQKEIIAALDRGIATLREQVETAKSRPRTDLLRLEALREEARANQVKTQAQLSGTWRQLAAEVGMPSCPIEGPLTETRDEEPSWEANAVTNRVLCVNSSIRQAAVEAERARIAVERARAGVVPNVTVGGGYTLDNIEHTAGGIISAEMALPAWDRQRGTIHEAEARHAAAEAAVRLVCLRLQRDTAEAYARYLAAKKQVDLLSREVLPRYQETLELLRKAYLAGGEASFNDLLLTEQSLNATRLSIAEARRSLWLAIADLQGLMQLDVDEPFNSNTPNP